jgi:putative ABC transport system permease protein
VRALSAAASILRRLRAEPGVVAFVFVLVAVTSLAVAAAPRLFDRLADEGLRYAITRGTPAQRDIELATFANRTGSSDLSGVEALQDRLRSRFPSGVDRLIGEQRYLLDSVRLHLDAPPNYDTFVTLHLRDRFDENIEWVDGRPPAAVGPPEVDAPPAYEVGIAEASAAETKLAVGMTVATKIDPTDPLLRFVFPRPTGPVEIRVVGIFRPLDPGSSYWSGDAGAIGPVIGGTADRPIAYALGILAPEAYDDLSALGLPLGVRYRYQVDPARLDASQLDSVVTDLRKLRATIPGSDAAVRTGLADLLDRYIRERSAAGATISVAVVGPLGVAVGAIGLVAILVIRRRRPILVLSRGRGASSGQLLIAQLVEGVLLTAPASLLAFAVAVAVIPSRPNGLSILAAGVVAAATTFVLLAATWPVARRPRRLLEREEVSAGRTSPRRIVFEALIVGLALAGTWLLRQRGLSGAPRGLDPFLAASPVLVGIAVALLTIRLYPLPVRALGWLAARGRGLVPPLALREIGRHPTAAYLPLLVLTLTVAVGTFASAVSTTIQRGQVVASWQDVGADYRVWVPSGGALSSNVDLSATDGVTGIAAALDPGTTSIYALDGSPGSTRFVALDAPAYRSILASSPFADAVPDALLAEPPSGGGVGTEARPVPVLASSPRPSGIQAVGKGGTFDIVLSSKRVRAVVVASADAFPGVPAGQPFVIAPRSWIVAAVGEGIARPTTLLVGGGPEARAAIESTVHRQSASAVITSRHTQYASMHDAPLVAGVVAGFGVSLVAALAYAMLAVVATVILDAQRRAREIGFLRTLGVTDRQVAALTLVEHGVPVIVALAVGTTLGLVVAWLLEPGLGLGAFIGPGAVVRLGVSWPAVATVALVVVVVVLAGVLGSAWLARRLDLGRVLRIGEE